ncbi:MAG: tRNA (adenosine(37)-N6)-dimethylallyltransferase MiaA [Candidatus Tectomicrobia bacterium RIFCSPLOWO2_02_FULL_70_19]|nr:MAG: tRNA (adenosine(37)-N6)-dimethylallyltransferase MiaA [Candidatus Tectomicrobia bacterium RIFCSPLOWO2_02_FULL_70_19]
MESAVGGPAQGPCVQPDPRPLVVLAGPTASGKTALAIALAERAPVPLEAIGADARQIYRGLPAGTAQPAAAERRALPHHMIGVADPAETFDAARYAREARACAGGVYARGAVPLVVGGSGLYLRAFVEGLFEGPGARPELRRRLEEEAGREGLPALHKRLSGCDPEAAAKIHPNDRRRIIRALEVFEAAGRPISSLRAGAPAGGFERPLWLGVDWPPEAHARRIEERVRAMLAGGMVEEAARLAREGLEHAPSFEGLGYAEALELGRGGADIEETVELVCRLHRGYAKRQRTWFRRVPGVRWLHPERGMEAAAAEAARAVEAYLAGFGPGALARKGAAG